MEPLRIESAEDLRGLVGGEGFQRVSLYVPFERAPTALHASELRLRASLERVRGQLRSRGLDEDEIATRLGRLELAQPSLRSLGSSVRTLVWLGDAQGWALTTLSERLPERVVVAQHYALRPLLRALQRECRFRVLAVSTNRVAAFEGDARGLREIELDGVPRSLTQALGEEVEGRRVSYRSDQPMPGRRSNAPIYHGRSSADDERALDRERFHRVLGAALSAAWRGSRLPVVLAAEVRTASELRKHLDLPCLLGEELRGNADAASAAQLHARAWPRVRAAANDGHQLAARLEKARSAGKAIEREFDAVAQAAIAGRIACLWVEEEARVPGHLDEVRARRTDGDDPEADALDAVVARVLERAGEVRVVEAGQLPGGGSFCAELR